MIIKTKIKKNSFLYYGFYLSLRLTWEVICQKQSALTLAQLKKLETSIVYTVIYIKDS